MGDGKNVADVWQIKYLPHICNRYLQRFNLLFVNGIYSKVWQVADKMSFFLSALILGIGTQAQMSIAMGEKNYTKAKTALKTGAISIIVYAIIIILYGVDKRIFTEEDIIA